MSRTTHCLACGKPIVLVNVDKMRGVIGLTQGWLHVSRWANPLTPSNPAGAMGSPSRSSRHDRRVTLQNGRGDPRRHRGRMPSSTGSTGLNGITSSPRPARTRA